GKSGAQHVWRIAAGRDRESQIARSAQGAELAFKEFVEGRVVRDRRQDGGVGRQCQRGDRGAVVVQSIDELRRDMLRVCRRAAVSENKYLAIGSNGGDEQGGGFGYELGIVFKELLFDGDAFGGDRLDSLNAHRALVY